MEIKVIASGSSGNSYRISDSQTTLLLDAGVSLKQLRIGCDFRLGELGGCFVTHYHGDHSKAVKGLLTSGVDVWMPEGEIEALGMTGSHHRLHPLPKRGDAYEVLKIGTMKMLPFRAEHDTPEPVGYLVASSLSGEKLLYFTDTFFIRYQFQGVTHIIGEVNYDREMMWKKVESGETPAVRAKRLFQSHMSLDNFLDFLRANDLTKLKQIYICHMSDDHGDEANIKEAVQRLVGAEVYVC